MQRSRKGVAIVLVLLVISLVAMIASALVVMGSNNLVFSQANAEALTATLAADAGAQHAARLLAKDAASVAHPTGTAPFPPAKAPPAGNVTLPNTQAVYNATIYYENTNVPAPANLTVPAGHFYILSCGTARRGTERFTGWLVRRIDSVFQGPAFGDEGVELKAGSYTDTWDSSKAPGTYAGTKIQGAGLSHVGTNSNKNGAVKFSGAAVLDPDAGDNPTASVFVGAGAGPSTVTGSSKSNFKSVQVMGSKRDMPPVDMKGIDPSKTGIDQVGIGGLPLVPTILAPGVYKNVQVTGVVILLPGEYFIDTLTLAANGQLQIVPDGSGLLGGLPGHKKGNLSTKTTLKISKDFIMDPDAVLNNQLQNPGLLGIEMEGGKADLKGGADAYCVLYAPKNDVNLKGGEIFGSLTAKKITLDTDAKTGAVGAVHYDKALQSMTYGGEAGTVPVVSVRRF